MYTSNYTEREKVQAGREASRKTELSSEAGSAGELGSVAGRRGPTTGLPLPRRGPGLPGRMVTIARLLPPGTGFRRAPGGSAWPRSESQSPRGVTEHEAREATLPAQALGRAHSSSREEAPACRSEVPSTECGPCKPGTGPKESGRLCGQLGKFFARTRAL